MGGIIDAITGTGAKKAKQAERLRREQDAVAQARQLSTLNQETARTALSRRQPRGRRLLADASSASLPSVVA